MKTAKKAYIKPKAIFKNVFNIDILTISNGSFDGEEDEFNSNENNQNTNDVNNPNNIII